MICIRQRMPCILVGPSGSGKTTILRHLASVSGAELVNFALNSDLDTMDLIGGYEQVDPHRTSNTFLKQLYNFLHGYILSSLPNAVPLEAIELVSLCQRASADSMQYYSDLYKHLLALRSKTDLIEIDDFVVRCQTLMLHPNNIQTARFEWVDGVLIKALEEGKWLVLDNANLCNSSVLDRLNSLLEPNGVLSINEHCAPSGEPRVVQPHVRFRLFMTMDPRFGELSRAMRNRAVEIYIDINTNHVVRVLQAPHPSNQASLITCAALDHLSRRDAYMLRRFAEATHNGLVNRVNPKVSHMFRWYLNVMEREEYKILREAVRFQYKLLCEQMHLSDNFNDAQPIHPLQNSPLVPLLNRFGKTDQIYWLGAILDFYLEILSANDAKQAQATALVTLKPSQMNRLQRSMCRDRIPSVVKDSTVSVAEFLSETLDAVQMHLQENISEPGDYMNQMNVISNIMQFWWQTYRLASNPNFEDALFQVHLAIYRDVLYRCSSETIELNHVAGNNKAAQLKTPHQRIIEVMKAKLQQYFEFGFGLTTGLSMENLWRFLQPKPVSSMEDLQILVDMEELAARFDNLKWKASTSLSELSNIMSSLLEAYKLILTSKVDGRALVKALSAEIDILETNKMTVGTNPSPFFSYQFEALRQYDILQDVENTKRDVVSLSTIPTASLMQLSNASDSSIYLQKFHYLWGKGQSLFPIEDSFSIILLHKLHRIGDVDLRMLSLLETELPILGHHLAQESASLCQDQLLGMNRDLYRLILRTIFIHSEGFSKEVEQWTQDLMRSTHISVIREKEMIFEYSTMSQGPSLDRNIPDHFQETFQNHLRPALIAIAATKHQPKNQMKHASLAWIHFAIAGITLYVPNRSFDPNYRQHLERQQHSHTKETLENKIAALRTFENMLTGQEKNLRCQILEDRLKGLGQPAEVMQEVLRPKVTELTRLQGEFNNLLNTILPAKPLEMIISHFTSGHKETLQRIKLFRNNLAQITQRLLERFRAYSDITVPAVGLLQCLQIGLHMSVLASADLPREEENIADISQITPFLGGRLLNNKPLLLDYPLDNLANFAMLVGVEGLESFNRAQRRRLLDAFQTCYENWSSKLEADRKKAGSKGNLYRFRGSAEAEEEDNEEEINELFPTYSEDPATTSTATTVESVRDTAVTLATTHAKIFLDKTAPPESVMAFLREMSCRIGSLYNGNEFFSSGVMTRNLLPGALLSLSDQMEALQSSNTDDSYNFYTDSNLSESRKLVTLICQIQDRFRKLQEVDEIRHMQTLEDVMASSNELLRFRHTEPLAKIITKIEKIHGFMHEWQFGGWASRTNSVLDLYDKLTSTIVSWRRLELATWARLFDMEYKKCDDDAKSWWFVAYEVVIAGPLSLSQSEPELRSYTPKLVQDLETYFATAIQGQFRQRLQLLKQLQRHLELLVGEFPRMSIVLKAIANFNDIYAQYETPVSENLQKGRLILEKDMRDILLLASWKDTNIVALRDSAKRSHHKLFKLVRKYRELLGQPMEQVLKQEFTADDIDPSASTDCSTRMILPSVDMNALALCESLIPHWSEKRKRLVNISNTVALMSDVSQLPTAALNGAQCLDSFVNNIISSAAELQKATPSILTKETQNAVKHLKSRKRKLFADTLRELKQMGIKHNLDTTALSKQDSLSVILSNTENFSSAISQGFESLEYYYHRALELLPRARVATRRYSEDLSSAEVTRSAGLLEGLLQIVLKQRNALLHAMADSEKLKCSIKMVEALWAPGKYDIIQSTITSSHSSTLKWLPNILRTGAELVKAHSQLGKIDSTSVLNVFSLHIKTFNDLSNEWQNLPLLPTGIDTTAREHLRRQIDDAVQVLLNDLADFTLQYPNLGFILQQIRLWAVTDQQVERPKTREEDVLVLDLGVSKICDSILAAIENFSTSLQVIPTSTEDPKWLISTDSCLLGSIASLHSREIVAQISHSFKILEGLPLSHNNMGPVTSAIYAVALPIFQQYLNIVQQSVVRYASLHRATCKTTYIMAKTFTRIASQGFCTPSEKADGQDGKTDKLEGGTGLGDGEGVEDISKDVQDDEDLSDLAKEPKEGRQDEIKDEEGAIDIADSDMEGEIGEAESRDEERNGDDETDGDDIDEEAGGVDDLDPNAIDEKMWDGEGQKAEKDQEADQPKGKTSKDKQVAAQDNDKQAPADEEGEEGEELGAEQGEEVKQDDQENLDPHAQAGQALELPEDIKLDGNDQEGSVSDSDDDMDNLSNVSDDAKDGDEEMDVREENISECEDANAQENKDTIPEIDITDIDNDEQQGKQTQEADERTEEFTQKTEDQEGLLRDHSNYANVDPKDIVPSEVQGTGEDQEENLMDEKSASTSTAQREEGGKGGKSSEQKESSADEEDVGRKMSGEAPRSENDRAQPTTAAQPFKRLGDALEKWHRQQTKIRDAPENQEKPQEQLVEDDVENTEFRHLQDEDAQADTQALGTATEDQAHTLDESVAIDHESNELPEIFQPEEPENDHIDAEAPEEEQQSSISPHEGRAGAIIQQANPNHKHESDDHRTGRTTDIEEEVEEVDLQLSGTHIGDVNAFDISSSDARQLWAHYESITQNHSLYLTEQLRLILAPTQATRMRGDFRTGKRLNIKRIIPYIASQYKRDKIWMRRSVPSKRSYQVMLAVDDSRSMTESDCGSLAFKTLVMVSRSLSMLEVGEICVVVFGENVKVAHDFDTPFSNDTGPKVFQNFSFSQGRTDIAKLVKESIELFRAGRAKATSSPADLWQLELIISDGVCDSSDHEPIRRLLREAIEERIMIVFIIVDDFGENRESVIDLKHVKFIKDEATGAPNVQIERYLDTFPFQYYLIVNDVKELPGVLATLLRQWFAEVADSSR